MINFLIYMLMLPNKRTLEGTLNLKLRGGANDFLWLEIHELGILLEQFDFSRDFGG